MDATPSGLELELGATCDDGANSPVISETLGVVNGSVHSRVGNQPNRTNEIHTTVANSCASGNDNNHNGTQGMIAPMFGVASVTEFLNSVSKADSSFHAPGTIVSAISSATQNSNMSLCRLGRRVGDVHRHFNYCIRDGKEYGICVYCSHTLQRNTTRQKHHLSTHCPHAPLDVKTRYDQERNSIHTRPAIEFQRKRSIDLPPGSISSTIYPNDVEGSMPVSALDIPVKVERLEERLETTSVRLNKNEKPVMRMSELEDEEDSTLPPVSLSASQLPPSILFSPAIRREFESSNIHESRFRKPLKIWDHGRRIKKGIVVSSLRELIIRGCTKLNISSNDSVRAVLEEDGTEVDDEEYLEYLPDNATILILRCNEDWKPPGPYDDSLIRARHRHRDVYRGMSERRDL